MSNNSIIHKHLDIFNTFKNDKKTEGFELKEIHEIYLPFWYCKQTIVAEKTVALDRFTEIILSTIKAGITIHIEICAFLGVKEDDFVTMQFHYLLKNELLTEKNNEYTITPNGLKFLNKKHTFQKVKIVDFDYHINDLTKDYFNPLITIDSKVAGKKNNTFFGYKISQSHRLAKNVKVIEHKNRPTFSKINQADFAALFNKEHPTMSFYDYENQDVEIHKRAIVFVCLKYVTESNEMEYEIRQFKQTVKKFNGYTIEKNLTKAVNDYYKHKPELLA